MHILTDNKREINVFYIEVLKQANKYFLFLIYLPENLEISLFNPGSFRTVVDLICV